jgi:diguanylate cyclase (GGDEF)-like protein/PAS domain S-box-containing protein
MARFPRRPWRSTRRRVPLGAILVALVVMPTAGIGALAVNEARARTEQAASARAVESLTEQFVALADLRTALSDEYVFWSGTALLASGAVAVDAGEVKSIIGTDLGSMPRALAIVSDKAYARAESTVIGPSRRSDGPLALDDALALQAKFQEIVANRAAIEESGGDFATTMERYTTLGTTLRDALEAMADRLLRLSTSLPSSSNDLPALTTAIRDLLVLTSALSGEMSSATTLVFSSAINGSALQEDEFRRLLAEIQRSTVRRDLAIEKVNRSLPGTFREQWDAYLGDDRIRAFEDVLRSVADGRPTTLDIPVLAQNGLLRVQMVSALLGELLTEAGSAAARAQAESQASLRTTLLVLGSLVVLTMVSLGGVVVAISRPLRRLAARAREVRHGRLDPSRCAGSSIAQIDDVALVFEDIVANLRSVEAQATALVEGSADVRETADGDDPGPLGGSVRSSLRRLADVTAQLQASEALSNAIVETAAEAIWTLDAAGVVRRNNAAARALLGEEERPGWYLLDRVVGDERGAVEERMFGEGLDSFEVHLRSADGSTVPVLLSSSTVELGAHRFVTVIARDITERKDLEAQLERHAATDPLSGLANRRSAMAAIATGLADTGAQGVAVVFCDLDGFKEANDVHGHAFGDAVLCEIARRFQHDTRPEDMLARLGGDEFVVVVPDVPAARSASTVACRLLESLHDPVVIGDRRVRVSGSFGVAWGAPGSPASDVLRDADTAMFAAKTAGGGRVQIFDEELEKGLRERIDIETGLRLALERGELTFDYQPVVAAGSDDVLGVEALVRWRRPGHGTVPPATFIAVAEQSELVVQIGRWGLDTATAQLAAWRDRVPPSFYVAVNIAGVHLTRYDIVSDVRRAIGRSGIDPAQLRIEITETHLVDDLRVAADAMRRLVDLGVSIVVDDYGTGFSSISYLRELPVSGIKVDRSFINRLGTARDRAMVESVVALARLLDLEVVAEGVETPEQRYLAERLGCDGVQGYHIARPMPVREVADWMAATRSRTA